MANLSPVLPFASHTLELLRSNGLPDDERELLELCLRSDRDAQWKLYQQHGDRVFRLMYRMVGPSHADDLTQQVFLCVFQKLGKFHGLSSFSTWLYRLASNEALQFLRRSHRNIEWPILCELVDQRQSAIERIDQQDLFEYALSRLEPELRAIFLLRESEQLSYYDIALALDIAEGTVASRLNRARRCLRQLVEADSLSI